jgi:hypothetical protein
VSVEIQGDSAMGERVNLTQGIDEERERKSKEGTATEVDV